MLQSVATTFILENTVLKLSKTEFVWVFALYGNPECLSCEVEYSSCFQTKKNLSKIIQARKVDKF